MRFETTPAFEADLRRLAPAHHSLFIQVARDRFVPAAESVAEKPGSKWPQGLRVKPLREAPGVWELTSVFSGLDGRATFEWIQLEGEPAIRWRRVGSHAIFHEP